MDSSPGIPPDLILDLMEAFRRSKVLFAAVDLEIFELLDKSPKSLEQLAVQTQVSAASLDRLLIACLALGLLLASDGVYRNTPVTEKYLIQRSPSNLLGYIRYSDRALYPLWGHLAEAVREGANRWEQVFGGQQDFFENVYSSQSGLREFIQGMHGLGLSAAPTLARTFDLSRFRHLVDLGGGSGHLAMAACQAHTHLRATVYDLPEVCRVAEEYIKEANLQDRVQTHSGNFFTDPLPAADLFALGRILHDWDEERVRGLLRKCFDRLPAAGAVLICEKLLNESRSGPLSAALQSLNMLVATQGKERTAIEYETILRDVGFADIQARQTGKYLDVVLATKGG